MRASAAVIVVVTVVLVHAACATTGTTRGRTAIERRAYDAFDSTCGNAGGPPTLEMVASEEGGKLYATLGPWTGGGMTQQQFTAVESCLAAKGVMPTWG